MKHFYPHIELLQRKAAALDKIEINLKKKQQLSKESEIINSKIQNIDNQLQDSSDEITETEEGIEIIQNQILIQQEIVQTKIYEAMRASSNEKVINYCITGPTQMGKTEYFLTGVKKCTDEISKIYFNSKFKKNLARLFVVSCDNYISQGNQMMSRIGKKGLTQFYIGNLNKKNFNHEAEKLIKSIKNGKSYVLVMLNNDAQVKKLDEFLKYVLVTKKFNIKRYIFLHDEGDLINKADNVKDMVSPAAKSHREWVHLIEHLKIKARWIKRFWISATPESCSYLHDITFEKTFVIPTSPNYIAVSDHEIWDGISHDLLVQEITRIRNNNKGEVILFCRDRKNEDQDKIAKEISNYDCIAVTYNSNGFKAYSMKENYSLPVCKEISAILAVLKYQSLPVVIVGYDLLNRGLSFVGKDDNPLTATTMFYYSSKPHIMGLTQRLGRTCGTSRPDLPRRKIYCSQEIYDNYVNYLKAQYDSYAVMYDNGNEKLTMNQLLELVKTKPATLNYERPTLPKTNKVFSRARKTNPIIFDADSDDSGEIVASSSGEQEKKKKIKELIDLWLSKNSITSKLLKFIYDKGSVSREELKNFFHKNGSKNPSQFEAHLTTIGKKYHFVYKKIDNKYMLNLQAQEYCETILKNKN